MTEARRPRAWAWLALAWLVAVGALAWQQAATNPSAVPAFAAPIVPPPPSAQDTYFHHNYAYRYNETHYQYQQLQQLQRCLDRHFRKEWLQLQAGGGAKVVLLRNKNNEQDTAWGFAGT